MNYRLWLVLSLLLLAGPARAQAAAPTSLLEQVGEFFARLLDPQGFPARWHCGHWTSFHGWLYIASDLLIWAAYFVIPFLLINFIRQRRDMPFDRLFWLFGLFIFACGATHLLDALIFWVPVYRLSGLVRLVTAVASWGTVWALVRVLPQALQLKTPTELEGIVQARTAELALANQQLQQVAEQLSRRNAEFSALANAMPQLAWMAESDGHIFWYNERWYEYTGTCFEQMQGWGWEAVHHPDHLAGVTARWSQHLAAGQPWEDTFPLRGHDGQYRWFLSRAFPMRNETGQVLRWFGTNTDVTDMRQLQEQVQHSETQYRVLMESIPQLVWTATSTGELRYCDQRTADYTGIAAAAWQGQPWHHLLHPADQPAALARWKQALQHTDLFEGEYRLRHVSGEHRWFLVQARLLDHAGQAVANWFGTCTEVHEQHGLREALQAQNTVLARTNRDLDTFVYAASHDLKQPAQNLAGLLGELKRSVPFADPEADLMLQLGEQSVQELLATVQALAEMVQVQRPTEGLPPEPVPVRPLVEEVIRSLQDGAARPPSWKLNFSAAPAIRFVRVNLRSILYNLLSNAVKYADPARPLQISVRTEVQEDRLVLVVQDTGLGIDLDRHGPDLFHLFRRFHDAMPGAGVGLYLVHRLVEQAGGHLAVESEVGQGSTFRVLLPQPALLSEKRVGMEAPGNSAGL